LLIRLQIEAGDNDSRKKMVLTDQTRVISDRYPIISVLIRIGNGA